MAFAFIPPFGALDVFTSHLLIVEFYNVHLVFSFPFFLHMSIIPDCGQTQQVS